MDDKDIFPSFSRIKNIKDEELENPDIHEDLLDMIYELLLYFDDMELSNSKEKNESAINGLPTERGAVLIFAPGKFMDL